MEGVKLQIKWRQSRLLICISTHLQFKTSSSVKMRPVRIAIYHSSGLARKQLHASHIISITYNTNPSACNVPLAQRMAVFKSGKLNACTHHTHKCATSNEARSKQCTAIKASLVDGLVFRPCAYKPTDGSTHKQRRIKFDGMNIPNEKARAGTPSQLSNTANIAPTI